MVAAVGLDLNERLKGPKTFGFSMRLKRRNLGKGGPQGPNKYAPFVNL
jgi:hypothetical protein